MVLKNCNASSQALRTGTFGVILQVKGTSNEESRIEHICHVDDVVKFSRS